MSFGRLTNADPSPRSSLLVVHLLHPASMVVAECQYRRPWLILQASLCAVAKQCFRGRVLPMPRSYSRGAADFARAGWKGVFDGLAVPWNQVWQRHGCAVAGSGHVENIEDICWLETGSSGRPLGRMKC